MGCNCKSENINDMLIVESTKLSLSRTIGKYFLKGLSFLMLLIALPLINIAIIWFMFNTLVLNKDVNIKPLLLSLGNKFKDNDDEDDDGIDEDEFNGLTEDDVVMVDVEDITNKSK